MENLSFKHYSSFIIDKIIISDIDEIPDINSLKKIKKDKTNFDILHFIQDYYYYNLTCKKNEPWTSSKIISYNFYINKANQSPHNIRFMQTQGGIKPGGWHLSYFGDSYFIKNKMSK